MQLSMGARQRLVTSWVVAVVFLVSIVLLWLAFAGIAFAEEAGPPACGGKVLEKCTPNSGDTAWMLTRPQDSSHRGRESTMPQRLI